MVGICGGRDICFTCSAYFDSFFLAKLQSMASSDEDGDGLLVGDIVQTLTSGKQTQALIECNICYSGNFDFPTRFNTYYLHFSH